MNAPSLRAGTVLTCAAFATPRLPNQPNAMEVQHEFLFLTLKT